MSHSKRRAKGQSYYLDAVNHSAQRYIRACIGCGRRGFDPAALKHERNRHLIAELQHVYEPLPLNDAGICEVCAERQPGS